MNNTFTHGRLCTTALLLPLAAFSFGGCGKAEENKTYTPPPYQPEVQKDKVQVVKTAAERKPAKNPAHAQFVTALENLDETLVNTLNAAGYWTMHSAWHSVHDRSRLVSLVGKIDEANEQTLLLIEKSKDPSEQLIFIDYTAQLGRARGALDLLKASDSGSIPDGGYHELYGLLFQTKAVIRSLTSSGSPERVESANR